MLNSRSDQKSAESGPATGAAGVVETSLFSRSRYKEPLSKYVPESRYVGMYFPRDSKINVNFWSCLREECRWRGCWGHATSDPICRWTTTACYCARPQPPSSPNASTSSASTLFRRCRRRGCLYEEGSSQDTTTLTKMLHTLRNKFSARCWVYDCPFLRRIQSSLGLYM